MQWNKHWNLDGKHAYLSASKYHWIRYDMPKLRRNFENQLKAQRGVEDHELAALLIKRRRKMPRNNQTFNAYVNDAIGFRMTTEQPLVYSDEFFGTPDAIKYDKRVLRIHDLKTGVHPGNMDQLRIYAALFFLEYGLLYKIKPHDVEIILRIYQNDEIIQEFADPDVIVEIMEWGKVAAGEIKTMKEVME